MDINLKFGLKNIELIKSSLFAQDNGGPIEEFTFNLGFNNLINPTEKAVAVIANIEIVNAKNKAVLGQHSAVFHFSVDNLDEITETNASGGIELHRPSLIVLILISLSTLRGMMYTAYRGTFLHNAILPIISADSLQDQFDTVAE